VVVEIDTYEANINNWKNIELIVKQMTIESYTEILCREAEPIGLLPLTVGNLLDIKNTVSMKSAEYGEG
jgi:hypothetical protein